MIRSGTITALVLLASSAWSEPITIRAGAHPGFSRLVMELPQNSQWEIIPDATAPQLVISPHRDGFDTSQVFDLIDNTHIAALQVGAQNIRFSLNCTCDVTGFTLPNGYLVIDIAERAQIVQSPQQAPRFAYGELLWSRGDPPVETTPPPPPVPPVAQRHLRQTRDQLLRSLSDAATRGILQGNAANADPQPGVIGGTEPPTQNPNLRVSDSSTAITSPPPRSEPAQCPDPSSLAVADWGEPSGFASQLGGLRHQLYQEFDRLSPQVARDLARLYIHFGFGAEARQTLALLPATDHGALLDLAELLEYGNVPAPRALDGLQTCGDQIGLWSILVTGRLPKGDNAAGATALRNLAELPPHLRRIIAPPLSAIFLGAGDSPSASLALRNLERLASNPTPQAAFVAAQIKQQAGQAQAAQDAAQAAVNSNSLTSPKALIKMINDQLETDEPIAAETALLIEAYRFELADHPLGPALQRAHVLASAKSGQFSKAFEALEGFDPELSSAVLGLSVRTADDITFLGHYFTFARPHLSKISSQTLSAMSQRLTLLGFPAETLMVLGALPPTQWAAAHFLRAAGAEFAMQNIDQALVLLRDVDSPEAERLRASILQHQGQAETAVAHWHASGAPQRAQEAAWLAQDWQTLTPPDTPVFGPMVEIAIEPLAEIVPRDGMLGQSRQAIQASSKARATLQQMLSDLAIIAD